MLAAAFDRLDIVSKAPPPIPTSVLGALYEHRIVAF
jgi:hypothetical protein